jgi:hypothetical protein
LLENGIASQQNKLVMKGTDAVIVGMRIVVAFFTFSEKRKEKEDGDELLH